ncbi:MAG TPA: hypothetical protein G4O15_01705 [Dehalococcoidia bacterium]|nr:hypothetical protein [Dehalococcoidia bacterium]
MKYRPAVKCKCLVGLRRSLVDSLPGTGTSIHDAVDVHPGLTIFLFVTARIDVALYAQRYKFIHAKWYKPLEVISGIIFGVILVQTL